MELQNGRPSNQAGRLEKEIRTYDLLDKLHVSYQRIDHEAAETMEICAEIDKVLEATICKNLFLCNRQKTNFYLLMMQGDKTFKTKELSKQIGSAILASIQVVFVSKQRIYLEGCLRLCITRCVWLNLWERNNSVCRHIH